MSQHEQTKLWQRTLAARPGDDAGRERGRLRESYEHLRLRAEMLAAEIARSLPSLTVHDVTHLDALWQVAELIAGDDYPLTPAEGFVLGAAILVHDLGLAVAAYPGGLNEIRADPLWADVVAARLRARFGRIPTPKEQEEADQEIRDDATAAVLRRRHAAQAETLASVTWTDAAGECYHLIEDTELRLTYGRAIGLIAASHWWSIEELPTRLGHELGAMAGYPGDWRVDPLRLACLLRVSDAAHIDARRAPPFLRALRRPTGEADQHWTFQAKLLQPHRKGDLLVYTATSGFSLAESAAWWQCYDTLHMIDRELRDVDRLLADENRKRYAVRGVSHIDDPQRLAVLIPADGWRPIDNRVHVSAVTSLVQSLGGTALYGQNISVPLRELIQNGADAVRARRIMERRDGRWGEVRVAVRQADDSTWIEVTDTGVGMSARVLTGPFLDFATTFWGSSLMHDEFPGLEAAGFSAAGKYGIGFFSVFMWGDDVQVITRPMRCGADETLVLEFTGGPGARPLLRRANPAECLLESGTRVRVKLRRKQILRDLLVPDGRHRRSLRAICARIAPTLDVNLLVETPRGSLARAVGARDWITINGATLLKRIDVHGLDLDHPKGFDAACKAYGSQLRLIYSASGNEIVGRACVTHTLWYRADSMIPGGVVTVGGLLAGGLTGVVGVLIGTPMTASRMVGRPHIGREQAARFASEEALRVADVIEDPGLAYSVARVVQKLGGDTGKLPIARCNTGWISKRDIACRHDLPATVYLIADSDLAMAERFVSDVALVDGVFAADASSPVIVAHDSRRVDLDWPGDRWLRGRDGTTLYLDNLYAAVVEAVAQAWGVPMRRLVQKRDLERHTVGAAGGKPLVLSAFVLRRP